MRGRRTLLLVDLELGEEIETGNEDVAGKVDGADNVEYERIIEGDALRDLHHTQDDDQVGAIAKKLALGFPLGSSCAVAPPKHLRDELSQEDNLHLRRESHFAGDQRNSQVMKEKIEEETKRVV